MTLGKKKEALETLKYFSEEVLKEDEELRAILDKTSSNKMLRVIFLNCNIYGYPSSVIS